MGLVGGISNRFEKIAVAGTIVIAVGAIVCTLVWGFLSGIDPSVLRMIVYSGATVYYIGLLLLSVSLLTGAITREKLNPYVRLGMLIAVGFLLAYGVSAGYTLVT